MGLQWFSLLVWWWATVPGVVAAVVADQSLINHLIEWVISAEHGIWNHEKIEIRRADTANYMGVFAKANIEPNEVLMFIPRERYIHVMETSLRTDYEDQRGFRNYYQNICKLAQKLQQELSVDNDSSSYAPYLAYLKQQAPGQLPARWSAEGKDRLRKILPKTNQDVVDWIDLYYGDCTSRENVEKDIIAMTIQRCYDVALIPLWDMVNHDNGKLNVDTTSWNDEVGIRVWASQPILAGQEVYATYDKCKGCSDVSEYWGTTEILRDFGFVESYPQRWTWDDEKVWFELHQEADGLLSVRWDDHNMSISVEDDYFYGPAKGHGLEFLRQELDRLQRLELDEECHATSHECQVIRQYHEAILTALSLAITAAEQAAKTKDERCTSSPLHPEL